MASLTILWQCLSVRTQTSCQLPGARECVCGCHKFQNHRSKCCVEVMKTQRTSQSHEKTCPGVVFLPAQLRSPHSTPCASPSLTDLLQKRARGSGGLDPVGTAAQRPPTRRDMASDHPRSGDEYSHRHSNKIQVSNTKKPLFFYVNLAKQFLGAHETVHLSGLGMAVATVVTVAEILKKNGLATVTSIGTSTVDVVDESDPDNETQKAKIDVAVKRSQRFQELTANAIDEDGYV